MCWRGIFGTLVDCFENTLPNFTRADTSNLIKFTRRVLKLRAALYAENSKVKARCARKWLLLFGKIVNMNMCSKMSTEQPASYNGLGKSL